MSGRPCVGYIRVSDARQAGEAVTSPADQRAAIEARAAKLGLVVSHWYQDEKSGGKAETRVALGQLIAYCEAHPQRPKSPGYVIALNDSRWGRFDDPEESAYWRTHLRKRCNWLVYFAENDDSPDPKYRTIMRAIGATQATQKREDVRANARRGSRGTASLGYWGTREPYGFRRAVVYPVGRERKLSPGQRKAIDEKVKLSPYAPEARVIRGAFRRYASGVESITSLTAWLAGADPARKWTRAAVKFALSNPAYCGDVVSGRYSPEDRERHPETEWIVTKDAHPAIVDRATFRRVQEILSRNAKWTTRVRTDWIVSGLVLCPCGKPYVAGGSNMNKRHHATRSYRCVTKTSTARCAYPGTIKKEWLERTIVDTVASIVGGPSQRKRLATILDRVLAERKPSDALAGIVAQLGEATASRDRLVDAVATGTLTAEEARSRLSDARIKIGRLEAQRDAMQPANADTLKAARDTMLAELVDFRQAAKTLRGPALRELLRPWIQSAVFDPATRILDLAIPHIPLSAFGDLASMACLPDPKYSAPWLTRRSVKVGP